jgi:hypothetical protein
VPFSPVSRTVFSTSESGKPADDVNHICVLPLSDRAAIVGISAAIWSCVSAYASSSTTTSPPETTTTVVRPRVEVQLAARRVDRDRDLGRRPAERDLAVVVARVAEQRLHANEVVLRRLRLVRRVRDLLLAEQEQASQLAGLEDRALAVLPGHQQAHLRNAPTPSGRSPSDCSSTHACHGSKIRPNDAARAVASSRRPTSRT